MLICVVDKWGTYTDIIQCVVAVVSFVFSAVAILISIGVAKLPFNKKARVKVNYEQRGGPAINLETKEMVMKMCDVGVNVNVVNTGNRDINFEYIGLAVQVKKGEYKRWNNINPEQLATGILQPSRILTSLYTGKDFYLMDLAKHYDDSARIYAIAVDTEDTIHEVYFTTVGELKKRFRLTWR